MVQLLYLEDEAVIRDVVCEYLRLKEYQVDVAVNGNKQWN